MKTFPMGGVHPSENKLSCAKPIEVLPLPDVVTIPLAQHIGAPAVAKVAKGDRVLTGQLIAEAGSFMSFSRRTSSKAPAAIILSKRRTQRSSSSAIGGKIFNVTNSASGNF